MANEFILMTDTNGDLCEEFYTKHNIAVLRMNYSMDNATYYFGEQTPKEFYAMVRAGKLSTTAAANTEEIRTVMEPHIEAGHDILYIAFGSGLSSTANNAEIVVRELSEKYPGRKIMCVDTLCASMGQGLLVYLANRLKESGASIEEVAEWAMKHRLNIAHYVVVDDLMHLHRGGRVSKASAIAGSMMGIKPIIHVDNAGKLIPVGKARGKKQAVIDAVDRMQKCVGDTKPDYFMVSHGDCEEDAKFAIELLSKRFGIKNYMTNFISPVIGSHAGPGTIAMFILAEHR